MTILDPRLALSGCLALDHLNRTDPVLARLFLLNGELEGPRARRRPPRRKYSPDQPCDEAGRWTDGGGIAPDGTPIDPIGGVDKDKLNWTTQQFISQLCKGNIRAVIPGQFLNTPINEVIKMANDGDPSARRCWKILKKDEYRK